MSTVDQFESVFKAAAKTHYVHEKHPLGKVLLVTDMDSAEAALYLQTVKTFLENVLPESETDWLLVSQNDFENVKDLLDKVEEHRPDLVITYRNLKSDAWRWPYSLGEHLDVLTQVTSTPVLVLPHPDREDSTDFLARPPETVMAVSGHLCGEGKLVGYSAAFTPSGGKLILSHVEDEATHDRYLAAIEKIPEIDSEVARETILSRLLKDAKDFSESAQTVLGEADLGIEVECHAKVGRRLEDYRKLIEEDHVDLLVMHAKEDDQMAMHGMAHPLAVELRSVPLLLL
ncbi:MAG: hypothetical protein HN531_08575 [Opitutae bacterium]|jgi:hypothetical protein|nr:hypothetical protein [Opitutae bacterium]